MCRYGDRDLPVVNTKGELLYKAWRDIFLDQRWATPILIDQYCFHMLNMYDFLHGAHGEHLAYLPREDCRLYTMEGKLTIFLQIQCIKNRE